MGDRGEDRRGRAVHDRGAEAAHHPRAGAVIREMRQIEDILDHRKTGADGEAGNDRVELVADAVEPEQADDDDRLQRFLDPRRDEPAVDVESRSAACRASAADRVSGDRADAAEQEQAAGLPQAHQLERVEPDEDREQHQHRHQRERPVAAESSTILRLT